MEDPRSNKRNQVDYPLVEILFLVISAVVSGVDEWKYICLFGENKLGWLRKFFPYQNGVPVPSTQGRLFAQLDNQQFNSYFIDWVATLSELTEGKVVAVDGKRMRGSYDKGDKKAAIHMVSAFASHQGVCLGQLATGRKSNEITAIQALLDLLTLEGCIVTIDAMGCQKAISQKILDKQADYTLQVKNNQKGLLEQLEKVFTITQPTSQATQNSLDHGRVETRTCRVIKDLSFFDGYRDWPGIKSLVEVLAHRTDKLTGKTQTSTRYYISSLSQTAGQFNEHIRSHWAIENNLHWVLDVCFKEDDSRKRIGNSAENFNIVSKIAINLLTKHPEKQSKNGKRLKAMLSDKYREELLRI